MTSNQIMFYCCAAITGFAVWAVVMTIMAVSNTTWNKIGKALADACLMSLFAVAFALVVVPVYVLTRLSAGVEAFMEAALPELSGLIYRVRNTARNHAEKRLASWNKSVEYDREDHARRMAEFDTAEEDGAEEAYSSAGVGERY
jgi:hypothetical protein